MGISHSKECGFFSPRHSRDKRKRKNQGCRRGVFLLRRISRKPQPFGQEGLRLKMEKETTSKYYYNDNGLVNLFLTKEEPRLLENLVALTLKNRYKEGLYYLKSQNLDVDFFVEQEGLAVQVAYSVSNISSTRETDSLIQAAKSVKEAKRFLIVTYEEEKVIELAGITIEVRPLWKWLLER